MTASSPRRGLPLDRWLAWFETLHPKRIDLSLDRLAAVLDELKLMPVLDLQMRLGEGTGACLLMGLIEAAVRIMDEMATFESAGVKGKIS